MRWTRDLQSWSLPDLSRRVDCGPHHWHVQEAGQGPTVLLLHGTGASTHSWRKIIPGLAAQHHVVALDLPGQGFTTSPRSGLRASLEAMTADIAALIDQQGWQPSALIGHSAGAAIALALARMRPVPQIIGLNPALRGFEGPAAWLFPVLAKTMSLTPFLPSLFAAQATPERTERLIRNTGSVLDRDGIGYYTRLMADRDHVNGTLQMMASWNLAPLMAELPTLETPVLFLSGQNDRAAPPATVDKAAACLASARVVHLPKLGHLVQEEAPDAVLALILQSLAGTDTLEVNAGDGR